MNHRNDARIIFLGGSRLGNLFFHKGGLSGVILDLGSDKILNSPNVHLKKKI